MISSDNCVCGSESASPIEAVRKISRSLKAIGARMVLRMVSAKAVMRAGSCSDIRIRPNWSPASRASVSCGFRMRVSRRASVSRMELPTAMPTESLTCLKRSRSITISVGRRFGMVLAKLATAPRRSMNNLRFGRPVRLSCTESCSMRSSAFLVSVTSVSVPTTRETSPSEPTTGRAFSANHMKWPSGVRRRKSCTSRPRRWSSTLSSAARKRSWSSGCSTSSHFAAGPSSVPRLRPEQAFGLRAGEHLVGGDVPVPDQVARAGQRQRAALDVGDHAGGGAAAGEGVLHDRKSDQHHDQHQAAEQRRADDVVGDAARHRHAGRDHPDHQQEPGRDQQHRAVEAVGREIDDQRKARRTRSGPATSARCRRRPRDRTAPAPPASRERRASRR